MKIKEALGIVAADFATQRPVPVQIPAFAGLPEGRIRSVSGHADRDLLLPEAPNDAANRRVSITVLRQNPDATP